jgi:iron complex transport system substrate-binding protein
MRIVSLLPSATDILAELGLLDSLAGVSEDCNWPPEVRLKPMVARTRIDVADLTSAEIDALVRQTASENHSLYAVDAQLVDALKPVTGPRSPVHLL